MRAMARYIVIALLAVLSGGCSMLGTHSKIYHHPDVPVRNVAIIIIGDDPLAPRYYATDDFLFVRTLAEEFGDLKLFDFTILSKNLSPETARFLEGKSMSQEFQLAGRYDAYLVCSLRSRLSSNHDVELRLYDANTDALLLSCKHRTSWGNAYAFYQPHFNTALDATLGALDAFQYRWKRLYIAHEKI